MTLFEPYTMGHLTLQNRIVLAPLTRCRANGNVPNDMMTTYYGQRASAGLLVTEGTAPSPDGLGYARIPGAYTPQQAEGWKEIAAAAHAGGAKIFMQLMHTGRITHPDNQPPGAQIVAPSAVRAAGQMWTDGGGMQDFPTPRALETSEIETVVGEFVRAARLAVDAGMDGIEIHGANGYLVEQFINPGTNRRTDRYGGTLENRNRFALELAGAVAGAIGPERTGIRLSPFGTFNDMAAYDETATQFEQLAKGLGQLGLAYLHIAFYDRVGPTVLAAMKSAFGKTVILNGGLNKQKAQTLIADGTGDLVAFGTAFIANPDLPDRMRNNRALSDPDPKTFYSAEAQGYIDYPPMRA